MFLPGVRTRFEQLPTSNLFLMSVCGTLFGFHTPVAVFGSIVDVVPAIYISWHRTALKLCRAWPWVKRFFLAQPGRRVLDS